MSEIISLTIEDAKERMQKAVHNIASELSRIRTGKATTALLDGIKVDAYGQQMPLNQIASIGTPEVRLLTIQPWDKTIIKEIEKAILKSDLGLNPSNDGTIIRLAIPQLTEERRRDMVKLIKKSGEDTKIAIRNIRRSANEQLKKSEKDHEIREDECYRALEDVQKETDQFIDKVNDLLKKKEEEIMQV